MEKILGLNLLHWWYEEKPGRADISNRPTSHAVYYQIPYSEPVLWAKVESEKDAMLEVQYQAGFLGDEPPRLCVFGKSANGYASEQSARVAGYLLKSLYPNHYFDPLPMVGGRWFLRGSLKSLAL